jgi:hypothetical protein
VSIRRILDLASERANDRMIGTIVSPFKRLQADGSNWMWSVDVDIGQSQIMKDVPVASNNRELMYSQQGMSVSLNKMNDGRWVVSGLAKTSQGLGHIMYVSFSEDIATVIDEAMDGYTIRPLTLGELGTLSPTGFGYFPFGCSGRFSAIGDLMEILES